MLVVNLVVLFSIVNLLAVAIVVDDVLRVCVATNPVPTPKVLSVVVQILLVTMKPEGLVVLAIHSMHDD